MVKPYLGKVPIREVTPKEHFLNRRQFMKTSLIVTSAIALNQCTANKRPPLNAEEILKIPIQRSDVFPAPRNTNYPLPESIEPILTDRLLAASRNNFYEFLPGYAGKVYQHVDDFQVDQNWTIKLHGLCHKPQTIDMDRIFKIPHEERLYHFRCVERWAMNVPWVGFPLAALLKIAEPMASAKYVRFVSAHNPEQMPGVRKASQYAWPYHEALRMDEAMHDLTLAVTGIYGDALPKQHGAPLRIVVPWKYGYKSPKSIVEIEFLAQQPETFWMINPHEYGFLSNVNPNIPHPRWDQNRSFWLGTQDWFRTPIFNGYEEEVAKLYPDEPRKRQKPLKRGQIAR
jgi:sulfoxide reductase catalytic subunit YedY